VSRCNSTKSVSLRIGHAASIVLPASSLSRATQFDECIRQPDWDHSASLETVTMLSDSDTLQCGRFFASIAGTGSAVICCKADAGHTAEHSHSESRYSTS
jgi:hypothetical protein